MALGWDTAWAIAAIRNKVPLTVAIPFLGQEQHWPPAAQEQYRVILDAADIVELVGSTDYSPQVMHARNRWMVDRCEAVVSLWDGSPGGTENCVRYAGLVGRPVFNLWPEWTGSSDG